MRLLDTLSYILGILSQYLENKYIRQPQGPGHNFLYTCSFKFKNLYDL
jgi:hypothetical protein